MAEYIRILLKQKLVLLMQEHYNVGEMAPVHPVVFIFLAKSPTPSCNVGSLHY